jgi:hypothetical protein
MLHVNVQHESIGGLPPSDMWHFHYASTPHEPPPNEEAWNSAFLSCALTLTDLDGPGSNNFLWEGRHFSWMPQWPPSWAWQGGCIPISSSGVDSLIWYACCPVGDSKTSEKRFFSRLLSTSVTVLFFIGLCFFQPAATPTPPLPFQVALRHRYSFLAYKVLTGPRNLANRTSL